MTLPGTAAGLLVILLGVLPGLPGDTIYRWLVGVSWREREFRQVVRVLSFSLLGVVLYSLLADVRGWHQPAYIVPQTFTAPGFSAVELPSLAVAYLGHLLAAAAVGLVAAGGMRLLGKVSPIAVYRDTWNQFVNVSVPEHWVQVTLTSGETYAGVLEHADVAVEPDYRDIILAEPYRYDQERRQFVPTMNQYLFIQGVDVGSVAAVYDANEDKERLSPVDQDPFSKGGESG